MINTTTNLVSEIKSLAGFKITNSHFALKSKIHLADYFFAKRFFQNSFFVNRVAYMVSRYILDKHTNKLNSIGVGNEINRDNYNIQTKSILDGGITLIGYGLYSELLVSLVEKFIKQNWNLKSHQINHDLISDTDTPELIKKVSLHSNIITIVPVASTFVTTKRIHEFLKIQTPTSYIFAPNINVLYISDGAPSDDLTPVEQNYGWINKDIINKEITLNILLNDVIVQKIQKYFITLPTNLDSETGWQESSNCLICNPQKDLLREKPLFDIDKVSVSPNIIYGFPKGRAISKNDKRREYILSPDSLKYIHYVRGENYYHYYIKIDDFYFINYDKIIIWLKTLKAHLKIDLEFFNESQYIIIFASGHYYNTGFANLVNEILFGNAANVIHYDALNDDIQNFNVFYGKEINQADKIFFIDDVLTTGTTFIRTNYFLEQSRKVKLENSESHRGIDGAIFLLNRTSHFVQENLLKKIGTFKKGNINFEKIYSFANIHLPSTREYEGNFPLLQEKNRYKGIAENSFLDRVKYYFLKQANKLDENKIQHESKPEHLILVEVTHRIIELFSNLNIDFESIPTYENFKTILIDKSYSPFENQKIKNSKTKHISKEDASIFKALTQYPLIQYEPIRKKIFNWILQELDHLVNKLLNYFYPQEFKLLNEDKENRISEFNYEYFKDLKFLMRRAALLNTNYLISKKFLDLIKFLQEEKGIPILLNKKPENLTKKSKSVKSNLDVAQQSIDYIEPIYLQHRYLRDFNVFYIAQVKEILFLNEERAIKVAKLLKSVTSISHPTSPTFNQVIRMLIEENSIIIKNFYEFIKTNSHWNINDITKYYWNDSIKEVLRQKSITFHYKYKLLEEFFILSDENKPLDNEEFLNYLWLMKFFESEMFEQKMRLKVKTGLIINKLRDIIDSDTEEFGAFFIVYNNENVEHSDNSYNLVFNKVLNGSISVPDLNLLDSLHLQKFIKGEPDIHKENNDVNEIFDSNLTINDGETSESYKTIIEFSLVKDGWQDLYTKEIFKIESGLEKNIVEGYNHLLLLRINKRESKSGDNLKDKPQGVIGFYFNSNKSSITSINKIKYLLLLRDSISHFIEIHIENNEFKDLQIAELRERASLLTGHGREMLMEIALKGVGRSINYAEIVMSLLLTQRLLLDIEEASKIGVQQSKIIGVFRKYFRLDTKPIDQNIVTDLKLMATEIFRFPEIENSVDVDVKTSYDKKFTFKYSKDLILMICFELFVNAKKNRWIFLDDPYNKIDGFIKNVIWIDAKIIHETCLQLSISNTGPSVGENLREKLQRKKYVKENDEDSSGLMLINLILSKFGVGNIHFIPDEKNIYKFNVILELEISDNDEKSNIS